MKFIIRWIITAIAVGAAIWIVPGVEVVGGGEAWVGIVLTGLILSLINISLKPLLQILSLPVTVLTLGVFYLIVNTLLLYLASWISNGLFQSGLEIETFGSAFVASIVISIVSAIVNAITGGNKTET